MDKRPIGIFDSGVGGLTVAHAVRQIMPSENIIYFGDTAHLPYGDKSAELITQYSIKIIEFLLDRGVKAILIACNSASSSAYDYLKEYFGNKTIIFDVITPVIEYTVNRNFNKVGVIGTKRTIASGIYEKLLTEKVPGMEVVSIATPLLVPMIEEGFIYDDVSNQIIRTYLSNPALKKIEALILGCTHYPIIRNQISKFFDFSVEIIDSSKVVSLAVREAFASNGLLNNSTSGHDRFFVSDYTEYFGKIAKLFFEKDIRLEKVNIWQ